MQYNFSGKISVRDELLILPAKVMSDYDPVAAAAEAADERPVYCRNVSTANGRLNPL